ncbi:MAG: helix-turn-helix domain-containing protein [Oscillospiraceae bacterium]|nr:helix-turn-helix domain-containing protein [Oscillospiraceae bacterium]
MSVLEKESVNRLFRAVLCLETEEECRAFFEDVCTIKEILDMSQRLEAAALLDRGENYHSISEAIGISAGTISRVRRCLDYGAGGYRLVLDRTAGGNDGGGA